LIFRVSQFGIQQYGKGCVWGRGVKGDHNILTSVNHDMVKNVM